MPFKLFHDSVLGQVKIYKRRDARSIKMSIKPGHVRITLPYWLPYRRGVDFARSHAGWVEEHKLTPRQLISGTRIGKAHELVFVVDETINTVKTKTRLNEIIIAFPVNMSVYDEGVQFAAQQASAKVLKSEAQALLPQRLALLAKKYGFIYKSVTIRRLRSRWGSCSHRNHISLNIYLMQLPWELIDYVLLHELTHTNHLNHSQDFWRHLENCLPDFKQRRKLLKTYQPGV